MFSRSDIIETWLKGPIEKAALTMMFAYGKQRLGIVSHMLTRFVLRFLHVMFNLQVTVSYYVNSEVNNVAMAMLKL